MPLTRLLCPLRCPLTLLQPPNQPRFLDGLSKARLYLFFFSSFFLPFLTVSLRSQSLAAKMQSTAFTLSPSLPLPKTGRSSNPTFNPRFDPVCVYASSKSQDLATSSNVSFAAHLPRRSWSLSSLTSLKLRPWTSFPVPAFDACANSFELKATSVPESAGESAESSSLWKTLELGSLFGFWYLFNIYFNIYNKQVRILIFLDFLEFW